MTSLHAVITDLLQNDPDPTETREWIESVQAVIDARRRRARPPAARRHGRGHPPRRRAPAVLSRPPNTSTPFPSHLEAKSPGDHAMEWRIRSIIRWNALAMVVRANRKPGDLGGHIAIVRVGGHPLRRRLQPLLARPGRRPPRRPHRRPGPQLAGHLRALVPGRPHQRIAARQLPHGSRRPRHQLVPASLADARLLAGADRVDGPGPARPPSTRRATGSTWKAAACCPRPTARCGPSSATARRTNPNRWAPSRWPAAKAWTTWSSSSTATCSDWTARCAATARSSRNWKASSAAPAGTSSRPSGAATGIRCWRATPPASCAS